jgi:hypothetical protein
MSNTKHTPEELLGEGGAACEYNWELPVIPYDTALTAINQYAAQQNSSLLEALKEIIKISDRKHDAWDKAKELIQQIENQTS